MSVPIRYIPRILTQKDYKKQKSNLIKSRKFYQKGIYYQRPKVSSFHSKPSKHVALAEKIYDVKHIKPNRELSRKTRCTQKSLEKIVNKGRGAYYSSGSRPNQTAESWGIARLASSVTGGKSSVIDYHILNSGCKPNSMALKLARKTRKRTTRKFMKQHSPKTSL